ncbi:MAG TPA: hypothetical protein VHS33_09500 [Sphingomicrobium sp.]|jgi:hypothetical protein|nr:hypothetical protein [Sphingomicrobium sp.]
MKLLIATVAGLALIASPAFAQPDNTSTATTHVKSTTKHVHATNVPVTTHHVTRTRHHAMRCGCPAGHMKVHHVRHVVKKTTTTSSSTPG